MDDSVTREGIYKEEEMNNLDLYKLEILAYLRKMLEAQNGEKQWIVKYKPLREMRLGT